MSNRGEQFYKEAEKKITGFILFNKRGKFEEGADLFTKSGNAYKSVRDFGKAGESYNRAAEVFTTIDSLNDAAMQYSDAGKMFAKVPELREKAIEAFRNATRIYRENSKPTQAAKLLVEASKLFIENEDQESAIEALKDAVQLYEDENQPMTAVQHLTTIADIRSGQKKWSEASKLYKKVAEMRLSDKLTQLAAGEYITKAVICQLAADDVIGAKKMCDEFINASPAYDRSREYTMLKGIFDAIENSDTQAYSQAVFDYDQIKRLDKWYTEVLLLIKQRLENGEEEDML